MACWEGKKYKLDKSENFDEYMKALGVRLVMRKMSNTVTPTVDLAQDGDQEDLDEETADGRKVKSVCTFENADKLVHEQKGDKPTIIIREFTSESMVATMTIEIVKCVQEYKAA